MQTFNINTSVPIHFTFERRKDLLRRKAISEMSLEDALRELLTSEITGLPNRRAFDEAERQPAAVLGMCDADGLKAINDAFGYAAGNQLLAELAEVLAQVGIECYHDKGDEFLFRSASADDLSSRLEAARILMRERSFASGAFTFSGADFSFGVGTDLRQAEWALKSHKAEREARGERARGQLRGIAVA